MSVKIQIEKIFTVTYETNYGLIKIFETNSVFKYWFFLLYCKIKKARILKIHKLY